MTVNQENATDWIRKIKRRLTLSLPAIGSWRPSAHRFNPDHLNALAAAIYTGRPLLVRGEPGLGKSQIARAVAAALQWRLVTATINSRTEVDDLLFHVDHVARLSDANVTHNAVKDLSQYVRKSAVWHAMEEEPKVEGQNKTPRIGVPLEDDVDAYRVDAQAGAVLLIDEIDKAHSDVPNALLEVLDAGSFTVPQTGQVVKSQNGLFIVITANDQRELPAAFLRRCAVLNLFLEDEPEAELVEIAQAHKQSGQFLHVSEIHMLSVAQFVAKVRKDVPNGEYKPGTSEYLDLLRVLDQQPDLTQEEVEDCIDKMGQFLVQKTFRSDEA